MGESLVLATGWKLSSVGTMEVYHIPKMPMQVHDILYRHGVISDAYQWGKSSDNAWITEREWMYETEFRVKKWDGRIRIEFKGLDTLADIYVNGILAGRHCDCYIPCNIDITHIIQTDSVNRLQIRFPSLKSEINKIKPSAYEPCRFFRKSFHDFTNYLGGDANFWTVGIYGVTEILYLEECQIENVRVDYQLNETLERAFVSVTHKVVQADKTAEVIISVLYQDTLLCTKRKAPGEKVDFVLEGVDLWWPIGYGSQALYEIEVSLYIKGKKCSQQNQKIGFRKIQMSGILDFVINGYQMKLWGANLTPDEGFTLCEDPNRMKKLIRLAAQAHVNTLRIWGEGVPYSDLLYDLADEYGILLWQEFFCGHTQYPDDEKVRRMILEEAEYMVKRLRHHPSVLLWCGGNECFLSRDFKNPETEYTTSSLFEYDLKELCARLDADRYYHINSPFGGNYANDPAYGDTHSYTNSWYVPGSDYPNFASENLRVYFPAVRSLKRYMKTKELPAVPKRKHGELPWPKEYSFITSAESHKKIADIEHFYDADTAEEMVYQFGMAAGYYIKDSVERYRRGKAVHEAFTERRCKGHLIWKWNTSFPHLYSSMLDMYLEPGIAYYFLKRAYEPVLVSIEAGEKLTVWVVNDSNKEIQGILTAQIYSIGKGTIEKSAEFLLSVNVGESKLAAMLDEFGQIERDRLVKAQLWDLEGRLLGENHLFLDIERHLYFPEACLSISIENNVISITSDQFAHCVELAGVDGEDEYGWEFSDNYFDIFPGDCKKIKIEGTHKQGSIYVKTAYCREKRRYEI